MTRRLLPIDPAIQELIDTVQWPEGVPTPAVGLLLLDGTRPMIRFAPPFTGADADNAAADFTSPGDTPMLMIQAMGLLADAWCLRHERHPGTYPDSPRAQIARALDMRTAGSWAYSIRLAAALASPELAR